MLDPKTLELLLFMEEHKKEWITRKNLLDRKIEYDPIWFGHLKELKYIDCVIHLEEQYRITPIGESAIIEHYRSLSSDRKSTFALALSVLALIVSALAFMSESGLLRLVE